MIFQNKRIATFRVKIDEEIKLLSEALFLNLIS